MHAGQITGAEAVRVRTEVMDTYRRLPILDLQLPARLLPPGWLREPARNLFTALYDGLAETAGDHVRAVADRFADGHPGEHRRRAGRGSAARGLTTRNRPDSASNQRPLPVPRSQSMRVWFI